MSPISSPGMVGLSVVVRAAGPAFLAWLEPDNGPAVPLAMGSTVRDALGQAHQVLAAAAAAVLVAR